jgi:hypothetical protein
MGQMYVQGLEPPVSTPEWLAFSRETTLPAPHSAVLWDFASVSPEILDRHL